MRKFNLKGTVVQRMMGIPREDPKTAPDENGVKTEEILTPAFSAEQGLIRCAWRTDVGRLRKNNQDAVILGNGLAAVADGMGGHRGGEIASAGLRDGLLRETKDSKPGTGSLTEAVKKVNLELWQKQENDSSLSGMGTTLTVIWPAETDMIIGQIGDSRAYLLRGGELTQKTEDHSMVADMVRKGVLTEEQAACHPMRNYITRAVGTEEDVEIDVTTCRRQKGDRWLICSDGLHGMITQAQLLEAMSTEDLEEAADKLLQAALLSGGKDNITLILLQDDTDIPEKTEETEETGSDEAPAGGEKPEEVTEA